MFVMPGIALSSARKSASGANPSASHFPKASTDMDVFALKSRQPPHTVRWTLPLAFIFGRYLSKTFCAAARDALSSSADHLHRHSRATVSKETPLAEMIERNVAVSDVRGVQTCDRETRAMKILARRAIDRTH